MTNHHVSMTSELQKRIVAYLEKEKVYNDAASRYRQVKADVANGAVERFEADVENLFAEASELLENRDDFGRRAAVELLITTEEFINAVNYYTEDIKSHLKRGCDEVG